MKYSYRLTAGLLISFSFLTLRLSAQEVYPTKTITIVVPFAAGSGADIGGRLLAKDLSEILGVTVVVDNKPGANGAIGAQAAARAKPDGYTLMIGSATTNATNLAFFSGKLGYDANSFDLVGGLGASPISLFVPVGSPWRTVTDLVTEAKKSPGKLSCGSGNSVTQVACEVFRRQAGFDAVTVPYKSNPQSLTDLVGGQISFAFADAAVSQVFLEGKKLRAIGVAAAHRNPATLEAPTFKEQGFTDFEITAWTAVFVPAGTPVAIEEKLNAAIRKSTEAPASVDLRSKSGSVGMPFNLPDGKRFAGQEVQRWARYVKESGVKPEQ